MVIAMQMTTCFVSALKFHQPV